MEAMAGASTAVSDYIIVGFILSLSEFSPSLPNA